MKFIRRKIILGLAVFVLSIFILLTCPFDFFSEKFRQTYLYWLPDTFFKSISPQRDLDEISDKNLFFEVTLSDSADSYLRNFNPTTDIIRPDNVVELNFVFIYPKNEPIDLLENKIKAHLALNRPREKQIVLPDKSTFVELIADSEDFNFGDKKIKDREVRYWRQDDQCLNENECGDLEGVLEIVLWQDEKYTFICNSLSLAQNIIEGVNSCLLQFQNKSFNKGMYFNLDGQGEIKSLVLVETDKGMEGCIEVNY